MKIVCESCGAKYSIADEKVAGKVFKIRCKRCSEVIVVRGDEQAEPAADGMGYGGGEEEATWHVVVNGEQAGPYTIAQLSGLLGNGTIDWEAYVWAEGFDNWVPMREVTDLVAAITGEGDSAQASANGDAYGNVGAESLAAQPSMGADPFADDSAADAGLFGGGAAAAANSPDLFGGAAAQPAAAFGGGGGAAAAGAGAVVASSPSPRVSSEQAMTGARNENSVLFSLKNLQALATGSSAPSMPPAGGGMPSARPAAGAGAGFAGGEGSGLIDIRALASATGMSESGDGGGRDELLSMGSQGGAFSAIGSPMLAPVQEESGGDKKAIYIAAAAAVGILGITAVAVAWILRPQTPVVQPVMAPPAAAAAAAVPTEPSPSEPAKAAEEEPTEGELAAKAAAAKAAAAEDDDDDKSSKRRKRRKSSGDDGPSSSSSSSGHSTPDPAPAAAPSKPSGPRTLDDLLDGALSGKSKPARSAPAPTPSNLPEKPSRDDVVSAMNSVKGAVSACAQGQSGVAFVEVTIAGKTGRVTNAQVTGITGPAGSCIAKAARKASFPKFQSSQFKVKYPFRL